MASKTFLFALLLACSAAVQGSSMKDIAVEYSQMLAEHLSEGVDEIERLKSTYLTELNNKQDYRLQQLVASVGDKVNKHPDTSKCDNQAKQAVHQQVQESVTNRFLHCINMTDQITELEKMIYNVSVQVSGVEDGVCLAITNLTSCSGQGIIEEVHCISTGLLGYINDFKQHSATISNIIQKFKAELEAIFQQFLGCFTNADNNIAEQITLAVKTHC